MAEITPLQVKDLREKTGAGMMDCRKALVESNGDVEKAIEYLRQKGIASASKRTDKSAKEGLVHILIDDAAKAGVIVEVNCETDFVARTEDFREMVSEVAKHILANKPSDLPGLMASPYYKDGSKSIEILVKEKIGKLGENMMIKRFARFEGTLVAYLHANEKAGTLIEVAGTDEKTAKEIGKELAMQATAMKPLYVKREDVPADVIEKEKEIYRAQMADQKKPPQVLEKIVEGKLVKFYQDSCLIEQVYIKDDKKKVADFMKEEAAKAGATVEAKRFARFVVGELA
jgi:elongation factor Ts